MKKILFLFCVFVDIMNVDVNAMEISDNSQNTYSLDEICNNLEIEINNRSFVSKFFEVDELRVGAWEEEAESKLMSVIEQAATQYSFSVESILVKLLNGHYDSPYLWNRLADCYVKRHYAPDPLIAVIETRIDMAHWDKTAIITKTMQHSGADARYNSYAIGLVSKGEFHGYNQICNLFFGSTVDCLEISEWLVLVDKILPDPQKLCEVKKIIKNNYFNKEMNNNCMNIVLNDSLDSMVSLSEQYDDEIKKLLSYLNPCNRFFDILKKIKRHFMVDMSIITHIASRLFQDNFGSIHIINHLMSQWLAYITKTETKLSLDQLGTITKTANTIGNSPLAYKLCDYVNLLTKLPTRTKPIISFVVSNVNKGEGASKPETLDFYGEKQHPSLSLLIPTFKELGYDVEILSWEDPTIDWSLRDCLFINYVWGYSKKQGLFFEWLKMIQAKNIPISSLDFFQWDIKKTYLDDLQRSNIPVIPTMIIPENSQLTFEEILNDAKESWATTDIIAKGVVDAGGTGYKHYSQGQEKEMEEHIEGLKYNYHGAVIQPFWPEITKKGELSFVFVGNALSHSYLKVCAPQSELVQVLHGGKSFHISKDDLTLKSDSLFKKIKDFHPTIEITLDELLLAHGKIHGLFNNLKTFFKEKSISPPSIVRIDCILRHNQLYIMELEGIAYLEMKEAMLHDPRKEVVKWNVNEIFRQLTITKIQKIVKMIEQNK